jgi:two-component system KDP operon response regulator KdpE
MTPAMERPHRCSVLVVDDDHEVREIVRVALTADGYDVRTAADGREALHALRSTPDTCMIVLDLLLPSMDAGRFRSAQLRDRSLAWIPVVVLSGSEEVAAQSRALGARSFVPKPLDIDALRNALRHIGCRRAQMPRVCEPVDSDVLSGNNPSGTDELAGPKP